MDEQKEMKIMQYLGDEDKFTSTILQHPLRRYVMFVAIAIVAFIAIVTSYIYLPLSSLASPTIATFESRIDNQTLGFEKIFVLNVPTRPDQKDILTVVASVLNLKLDFWAASSGDSVPDKGLPDGAQDLPSGARGELISQMSIYQHIIDNNIQTALIIEEDADFDIRIRSQLHDFAKASRILNSRATTLDNNQTSPANEGEAIHFDTITEEQQPLLSPYGDRWDALWLGSLGQQMLSDSTDSSKVLYHSYVVQHNDTTSAQYSQQRTLNNDWWNQDLSTRPDHTRLYHSSIQGVGTQAYAISITGARHALYALNVLQPPAPIDIALREFCQSTWSEYRPLCLTTQPSLFSQFKMRGSTSKDSNINDFSGGFREKSWSDNVRWSVRNNLDKLMAGEEDFEDAFPDGHEVKVWTEED